jgi:hypothetical protein
MFAYSESGFGVDRGGDPPRIAALKSITGIRARAALLLRAYSSPEFPISRSYRST